MVDTVEQGTETVEAIAVPTEVPSESAVAPAATPEAIAPEAAPAAKRVPVKRAIAGGKKTKAQAVTKVEPAVETIAPAKAAEPKRAVRKARLAKVPAVTAAPVAVAPVVAAVDVVADAIPAPIVKPVKIKSVKIPKTKPAKITATKPATQKPAVAAPVVRTSTAFSKELRIMTTPTTEYAEKFQTVIKDASEKAKAAFEKSQSQFGEIGAFTKGNVEALVESSKILASGLTALSKGYMTESKSAFAALTAEFKEFAAVKSPTELLEKQSTLIRKQFDSAVATSSKNSEAVLKLANEAFQPISNRVSIAVEKIKHAA
jgi:phasin family protein